MDQGLKERLIGAAVLVALAVWLIPWLLDGPEHPLPDDEEPLRLPVPSGHVGEVRTEVIDLSPRRQGDVNPSAASDARASAGERRTETPAPRRDEPASAPPSVAAETAPSPSVAPGSDAGAASESASGTSRAAAPERAGSAASTAASSENRAAASAARPSPTPAGSAERPAGTQSQASAASRAAPAPSGDWAVQVGSFGDEGNAERLAQRVAALGHSPRITTYRAGGRVMYRVRIGPHATREAAEAAASALAARGFPAQVVTAE